MSAAVSDTIVICIGNELIADDAAGFEIYNRIGHLPVRTEYCSVGGINILPMLNGERRAIIVDAVELGSPPGTLHILSFDQLPVAENHISAHGLGIRESIEIGRILYPDTMPDEISFIGIEGRCFNRTRDFMTPEVMAGIDNAVIVIEELVKGETT